MATQRYARPPIVEAVFEIQFADHLSERVLDRLRERFKTDFPTIEEQQRIEIQVKPGAVEARATRIGFKMTAANAVDLIMLQVDRFGSSRLAPYPGWEVFIEMAKERFETFTKIAGRRTLIRVASRYINRIDIPVAEMTGVDILEFVRIGVAMPGEVSSTIGPFSVAANILIDDVKLLIQCQAAQPALIDHVSLTLDIDASIDNDIKPHKDAVWQMAQKLREAKNRVFEASITDRIRGRFQ